MCASMHFSCETSSCNTARPRHTVFETYLCSCSSPEYLKKKKKKHSYKHQNNKKKSSNVGKPTTILLSARTAQVKKIYPKKKM